MLHDQPDRPGCAGQRPTGPELQLRGGLQRLPAVLARRLPADLGIDPASPLLETPVLGSASFGLNGPDSAEQPGQPVLAADDVEHPRRLTTYPQFKSDQAIKVDGPPAFDPPTGSQYVYSQQADSSYKRLTHTVDLTGKTSGALTFKASYDTEPDFDYVFVEAHTVGQDDWTTLPDANNTSQDTGVGCPDDDPFWLQENPFLTHYITRSGAPGAVECAPNGTTRGVERGDGQLGRLPGLERRPELVRGQAGRGVDHVRERPRDAGARRVRRRRQDHGRRRHGERDVVRGRPRRLDVPGAPADSGANANDWIRTGPSASSTGPGVATDHSVYWGFGLEGVDRCGQRATLIKDAMGRFGIQ